MFAVPDAVTPMIPAFAAIGALCVAATALSFFNVIYKTCLRGGKNLKKCYGEWAVVTGATDGIGKAMAFELARKGMSVLLVGRSKEKLKAVREELSAKHPHVQVTTEVVDFASFSKKDCARMMGVLDKLEVGVLVNNVGISYAFPQWFHELTEDEIQSLLTVNIESVVWMTRAVMPQMLKRKRGAVVNMSSASARPPNPLLTVYSSTKGFVENFTKSLAIEYASSGISFQCQSPLYVATSIVFPNSKVAHDKRASIATPTTKTYARYAVARIGYDTMVSPYWVHEIAVWLIARLDETLVGKVVLGMHKGVRFHKKNVALMEQKKQ
jgi:17beta-estradiol 17-dehydrogenase / very-long-chain 3-oxoacyl-CoA reductase